MQRLRPKMWATHENGLELLLSLYVTLQAFNNIVPLQYPSGHIMFRLNYDAPGLSVMIVD